MIKKKRQIDIQFADSQWSLRIERIEDKLVLGMHWGDKEEATHSVVEEVDELKDALAYLFDDSDRKPIDFTRLMDRG